MLASDNNDDGKAEEASEVAGSSSAEQGKSLNGSEDRGNKSQQGEENPREQKNSSFSEIDWEFLFPSIPLQDALDFTEPNDWDPKVTVIVENMSYICNPMLLHAYSRFFVTLPDDNAKVIKLPEGLVTPGQFAAVYDWILAEKPELSRQTIVELYASAKKLEVINLVEKCEACFEDEVMFREAEAYMLVVKMNAYEMRDIQLMMVSRITRFFQQLISSTDFIKLDIDIVCLLLHSGNIGVNTEADVLYAGILWLGEDWENRHQHIAEIIACVEFTTVPPDVLQQFVSTRPQNERSVELIREDQSFMRKVFGGLIYNEFANTLTGIQSVRKDPDKLIQLRRRIFDPQFALHYKPYGEEPEVAFTFKHFLAQRKAITAKGNDYWKILKMFGDSKLTDSVQD